MADQIVHLKDLHQDPMNARNHNPRNLGMVVDSLREVGAARSGVVDEDGRILAGNLTWEALAEAGIERVRVVDAGGDEWVVVRRAGLTEAQKRRLALFDNRTSELATWDPEVLAGLVSEDGSALDGLWTGEELERLWRDLEGPGEWTEYDEDMGATEAEKAAWATCPECGHRFVPGGAGG